MESVCSCTVQQAAAALCSEPVRTCGSSNTQRSLHSDTRQPASVRRITPLLLACHVASHKQCVHGGCHRRGSCIHADWCGGCVLLATLPYTAALLQQVATFAGTACHSADASPPPPHLSKRHLPPPLRRCLHCSRQHDAAWWTASARCWSVCLARFEGSTCQRTTGACCSTASSSSTRCSCSLSSGQPTEHHGTLTAARACQHTDVS